MSSPPCPGWDECPLLGHHGETAPDQRGTARGGEQGPPAAVCDLARHFIPACVVQAHVHLDHPYLPTGGGCKRGPAPLVLPQLYYCLSVELIDIEPECTVQQLSVNYLSLSIYCSEHDLGLQHMNLLLVKTSSITFSLPSKISHHI